MYIRKSTQLRLDSIATANGQCQLTVPNCVIGVGCSGCINDPINPIQERGIAQTKVTANIFAVPYDPNYLYTVGTVAGKNPNGTTAFLHVLDSTQSNSTGPVWFTPFIPGDYLFHTKANIMTTSGCNILPATTPQVDIMVHAVTTFHRGDRTNGSLSGAVRLPAGTGYYHYWGNDTLANPDDYGGAESTNRLIQIVGGQWFQSHPTPRIGIGDISRQSGGEFRNLTTNILEHIEHQNGLDVDIYYVGKETSPGVNYEGLINLTNTNDLANRYDRARTVELLNLFAANASIHRIFVNPNAGISSADVPGVNIVVDVQTKHTDHFHLSLVDPDGLDTNNCP
jgi:murein endopeptidase